MPADARQHRRHVAVVGAGPAGLMVAERLARRGVVVTVFERMPSVARKFLMAGRGGLNLTHSEDHAALRQRYAGSCAARVAAAVDAMPAVAVRAFADSLGQATFVGSSGRVFPEAMKASPMLRAWLARLADLGVTIRTRTTWTGFGPDGALRLIGADGTLREHHFDATVLALGGASWPRLGADGAWTRLLPEVQQAPLQPANAGVCIDWTSPVREAFAGTPLKRIGLTVAGWHGRGEAIVTRDGLEGGVIYAATEVLRQAFAHGPVTISVDLKPDLGTEELAARIAAVPAKQSTANALRRAAHLSPVALAILREAGPIDRRDPVALARRIGAVAVVATGFTGLERAISTAGGIHDDALDANGMLRARPGVFATGEMLDWSAPTGGYLLTGCLAGARATADGVLAWLGDIDRPTSSGAD
jgi:hypothetical protein